MFSERAARIIRVRPWANGHMAGMISSEHLIKETRITELEGRIAEQRKQLLRFDLLVDGPNGREPEFSYADVD